MSESQKKIYRSVARLLLEAGKAVDSDDRPAIELIGGIAYDLRHLDAVYEEKYDQGALYEIDEWMSLKIDAPDMADEFGANIQLDYPTVFADE